MKRIRISVVLLSILLLCGCGAATKNTALNEPGPDERQMRAICELATLELFYHNTAKLTEPGKFLWWDISTEVWVEYSGTVILGIDVSDLDVDLKKQHRYNYFAESKSTACNRKRRHAK